VFFWGVLTNLIFEDKTERTRQVFYVLRTFVTCFYTPASKLLEGWKRNLLESRLFVSADIVFTRSWSAAWLDPANWKVEGQLTAEPVPHLERIPCTNDRIVFQEGNTFRVRLPDVAVTVGRISLLGQVLPHSNHSV